MDYAICEDQTMVRQILREKLPGCIWEGRCIADLATLPKNIELLVLDLELPDGNALDWLDKQKNPPPVIILTSIHEEVLVLRALKANYVGLIHKEDAFEVLQTGIAVVLNGGVFISKTFQQMRSRINSDPDAYHKLLTQREQEVLSNIGLGFSNTEVAQVLGLKEASISDHKTTIMRKLGLTTTAELMRYAIAKGFCKVGA